MQSTDYSRNTELLEAYRLGDESAKEELITLNMGLIRSIALRFRDRATEGHGCDFEDLVQIGTIGLLKAIKSYDADFGTAFSTYAVPLIIGEIKRFLRDDGPIKVSRSAKRTAIQIMRVREEFINREGREPKVDELAVLCDLSVEELCASLLSMKSPHSFSEKVGDDGNTLEELIADDGDALDNLCDKLALREAIQNLPPLWRKIVTLRYFRDMSQQQTAAILGLTQVKISREEKKIFSKLRIQLKGCEP